MKPSCTREFASTLLAKRTGTRSKYMEKSHQEYPTHASKNSWEDFMEKLDLKLKKRLEKNQKFNFSGL